LEGVAKILCWNFEYADWTRVGFREWFFDNTFLEEEVRDERDSKILGSKDRVLFSHTSSSSFTKSLISSSFFSNKSENKINPL
jgi:hypothetical protein